MRGIMSWCQIYTALSRARTPAGLCVSGLQDAVSKGLGVADKRALGFYRDPDTYLSPEMPPGGSLWPTVNDLKVGGHVQSPARLCSAPVLVDEP